MFLLENVEMGKRWERVFSEALGIHGVHINSALVSAQNRRRIYWSNIRVREEGLFGYIFTDIPQPADRGILLRDMLEKEVDERYYLKDEVIRKLLKHKERNKMAGKGYGAIFHDIDGKMAAVTVKGKGMYDLIKEPVCVGMRGRNPENPSDRKPGTKKVQRVEIAKDGKTNCLTSFAKDNLILTNNHLQNNLTDVNEKANAFLATSGKGAWANGMTIVRVDGNKSSSQPNRVYSDGGKSPNIGSTHFSNTINVANGYRIRRITPTECARLQTIPEWYKWECSATQQYRLLGNGWTVEVIKHILSFMKLEDVL